MALYERTVVFKRKDKQGNTYMEFPVSRVENIEGAVASINGKLPDDNQNVTLGTLDVKAENPITAVADDTTAKWVALGSGTYNFTQLNCLNNQPNQWGILINVVNSGDVFQIWKSLKSGAYAYRAGNSTGWGESWQTCANLADLETKLNKTGGKLTGELDLSSNSLKAVRNIELIPTTNDNHGGFIDFHFKGSTSDYTSRIIEEVEGQLRFQAPQGVKFDGTILSSKNAGAVIANLNNGGELYLFNPDDTTYKGGFLLRAKDNAGNVVDLLARADGVFQWNNKDILTTGSDVYNDMSLSGTKLTMKRVNGGSSSYDLGNTFAKKADTVFSVNGVTPDDNGNVAFSETNEFESKVINLITDSANDTQAFWKTVEAGVYWFSQLGCITDQPSQYGHLIHFTCGGELFQLWKCDPNGALYHRGGNDSGGWNGTWQKADGTKRSSIINIGNVTSFTAPETGIVNARYDYYDWQNATVYVNGTYIATCGTASDHHHGTSYDNISFFVNKGDYVEFNKTFSSVNLSVLG